MKLPHSISGLLLLIGITAFGQNSNSVTHLRQKLKRLQQQPGYLTDTAYANALIDLAYLYSSGYPDSVLLILSGNAERCWASGYKKGEIKTYLVTGDAYVSKGMYQKALENYEASYRLARNNDYNVLLSSIPNSIGTVYLNQGNYAEALNKFYESLKAAESLNDSDLIGATLNNIAVAQFYQDQFSEAESTYTQRLRIAQNLRDTNSISVAYNNLGEVNLKQKNPAKALHNLTLAYHFASQINDRGMLLNTTLSIAEVYFETDSLQKAETLFEKGLQLAKQTDHGSVIAGALIGLAKVRYKQGLLKKALANGLEGLQRAEEMGQVQLMRDANEILSSVYEAMNDGTHALQYYRAYKLYSDSMNNLTSQRAVAIEKDRYEFSKKEDEFERRTLQQQWLTFSAFAGVLLLVIISWLILRNRNRLAHTYKELQHKNTVIETEKSKAESALSRLQATQAQLIQSEKMASLGELTAGIAHEIQNPLNFVNNFSDVSNELLDEMNQELSNGDIEEAKAIGNDIRQNLEKITYHGKRADAIVKGMLQHSRKNTGQKESTDINALCDEYLRLSYHGLRAKDKSFNADFKTDFDESIHQINMVPQDIGRVLLNLFNNAFYAVNQRKKLAAAGYQALVSVSTKKVNDKVEIVVADNGSGIPQNIVDKIFQPFFTTKPTGEGTGLGLSLSYDIIKSQNGTITVETKEGEGTRFLIQLPVI